MEPLTLTLVGASGWKRGNEWSNVKQPANMPCEHMTCPGTRPRHLLQPRETVGFGLCGVAKPESLPQRVPASSWERDLSLEECHTWLTVSRAHHAKALAHGVGLPSARDAIAEHGHLMSAQRPRRSQGSSGRCGHRALTVPNHGSPGTPPPGRADHGPTMGTIETFETTSIDRGSHKAAVRLGAHQPFSTVTSELLAPALLHTGLGEERLAVVEGWV